MPGGLYGGRGADTIDGGSGSDRIVQGDAGDGAEDTLRGGDGDDVIEAANARQDNKDSIECGNGNDKVYVDNKDVVSADCEVVENVNDRARQDRADKARLTSSIAAFEKHMTVGADGKLDLDTAGLDQENVDPGDRVKLKNALNDTNQRIRAGEFTANDVFPSANARIRPLQGQSAQEVGVAATTPGGVNGFQQTWFGTQTFLDNANTNRLIAALGLGTVLTAGSAAIDPAIPVGLGGFGSILAFANAEGNGVIIAQVPGFPTPFITPQ